MESARKSKFVVSLPFKHLILNNIILVITIVKFYLIINKDSGETFS